MNHGAEWNELSIDRSYNHRSSPDVPALSRLSTSADPNGDRKHHRVARLRRELQNERRFALKPQFWRVTCGGPQ